MKKLTSVAVPLLFVLGGLLGLSAPASAAITFVCAVSNPSDNGTYDQASLPIALDLSGCSAQAGDLVIIGIHGAGSNGTASVSNSGGQTWTDLNGSGSTVPRRYWSAVFDGTWDANPSMTFSSPVTGQPVIAVAAIFRPTTGGTWDLDVSYHNIGTAPSSPFDTNIASQATTAGASLVSVAFFSSPDDNTWQVQTGGWTHPGGQTQWRNTTGNDRSVSMVYRIESSASGSTGEIVNRQTANGGDNFGVSLLVFRETVPEPPDPCEDQLSAYPKCRETTSIHSNSFINAWNAKHDPDIEVGHYLGFVSTTDPGGYEITLNANGTVVYPGPPTRQRLLFKHWDGEDLSVEHTLWVNAGNISCDILEVPVVDHYKIGSARTIFDFTDRCSHSLGDGLVLSLLDTPPAGVGVDGLKVEEDGTSTENEAGVNFTALLQSDVSGVSQEVPMLVYPLDTVTVPDCTTAPTSMGSCAEDMDEKFLLPTITFLCRALPAGQVISQYPTAGTEVDPDTNIGIVASIDPSCVLRRRIQQESR